MANVAPSDDPRDHTRDRLVAAAAEVFAEKGYDRAGVQEIARRAGLTTGAIYGRFTGKAELLLAAIEDNTTDELDELFNEHRFDGQASTILRTVGSHLVTPTPDDPDEGALLLEAFVAARRDDDVRQLLSHILASRGSLLAELVEVAKVEASVDPAFDTDSLVTFCHALGLGFLLFDAISLPLPAAAPWEHLITRLVAALAPAPSTTTQECLPCP
ncbi:MAG: TetR/AcrR family transcriptional regulator [Acidimicrobiales bacterium]